MNKAKEYSRKAKKYSRIVRTLLIKEKNDPNYVDTEEYTILWAKADWLWNELHNIKEDV